MKTLLIVAMMAAVSAQDPPQAPPTAAIQAPAPTPAVTEPSDYLAQITALQNAVFERDNEIVHLQAEWANCRATVDSTMLTSQAIDLVRRCEATFGGKCTWDEKTRRVVRVEPEKEREQ